MLIEVLRAKVHGLTITDANLQYKGSLTLDEKIMEKAGLFEFEKVLVVNQNGERLETYLIKGARGSGICCLNGPAARKGLPGDKLVVMSFGHVNIKEVTTWLPVTVFPNEENQVD